MTTDMLGKRVKRVEDQRLITGKGRYVDDIKLQSMAHCAILRSPYAHANIRSIDTSAARAMPGVLGVMTGADIPYNPLPMAWSAGGSAGLKNNVNSPRALATYSVKWTGEGVAAVIAETPGLAVVQVVTGIAGLRGRLPGVEPKPYIIRFTEDRPNPLYRRVCYTLAWSEAVALAALNIAGLVVAILTGHWYLKQMYRVAYFPISGAFWLLGAFGRLPRVKPSTRGEGHERRYFYGTVWAVSVAQPVLWFLWAALPRTRAADALKLAVFAGVLAFMGLLASRGRLPRTRPIVPGEWAISD